MYLCVIGPGRCPLDQVESEAWTPAENKDKYDHQQHLQIGGNTRQRESENVICKKKENSICNYEESTPLE